jgi:SH3 domain protein
MNRTLLAFAVLLLAPQLLAAQVMYVSDQLETSLRRGEGLEFKIRRMLKSGEALEVLSVNETTGYTKIVTPGGTEGFVLSRHLMDSPPARELLNSVQEKNLALLSDIEQLESKISELDGQNKVQADLINTLQSEKTSLSEALTDLREATADVVAIKEKNDQLVKQVSQFGGQIELLEKENADYRDSTEQDWFIRGAAVVLLGILIGLVLPKLRRRRRWGEL